MATVLMQNKSWGTEAKQKVAPTSPEEGSQIDLSPQPSGGANCPHLECDLPSNRVILHYRGTAANSTVI